LGNGKITKRAGRIVAIKVSQERFIERFERIRSATREPCVLAIGGGEI
jgi:hypothetical protein